MNNIFKQLVFTAAFIFCISMTASAQDGKKPPPKKVDPPVVVVKDKDKSKEEKPRDNDNRKKKPQVFFLETENVTGINFN